MKKILAVVLAIRNGKVSFKESWWVILLQFIYCADVVATVIFYVKLKKMKLQEIETAKQVTDVDFVEHVQS